MEKGNVHFKDNQMDNENDPSLETTGVLSKTIVSTDDGKSHLSTSMVNNEDNEQLQEQNVDEITENAQPVCDSENKLFTITHEEEASDEEPPKNAIKEPDFIDISSVGLLRGTVSELERALQDSRVLIKTRDDEIVRLRREIEQCREQIHKEQMKWQRKGAQVEERNREIQELQRKLNSSEKSNEELAERIKEYESPFSESDGVSLCCSSMKELMEVKIELAEKELLLQQFKTNNLPNGGKMMKAIAVKNEWETKSRLEDDVLEQHNKLKLKFLRDAFFYFMIDFHSEEQIKAILAVLAYGDQREEVIKEAFRMRQRGKKFTVKEVSSRELSFLHEEI